MSAGRRASSRARVGWTRTPLPHRASPPNSGFLRRQEPRAVAPASHLDGPAPNQQHPHRYACTLTRPTSAARDGSSYSSSRCSPPPEAPPPTAPSPHRPHRLSSEAERPPASAVTAARSVITYSATSSAARSEAERACSASSFSNHSQPPLSILEAVFHVVCRGHVASSSAVIVTSSNVGRPVWTPEASIVAREW